MSQQLSANALRIVNGSLSSIEKREQLGQADTIVSRQVGELSLGLPGDAWDRSARVTSALVEIATAYIRSLAEQKLQQKGVS